MLRALGRRIYAASAIPARWMDVRVELDGVSDALRENVANFRGLFLNAAEAEGMSPSPQPMDWWIVQGTFGAADSTLYFQVSVSPRLRVELPGATLTQK